MVSIRSRLFEAGERSLSYQGPFRGQFQSAPASLRRENPAIAAFGGVDRVSIRSRLFEAGEQQTSQPQPQVAGVSIRSRLFEAGERIVMPLATRRSSVSIRSRLFEAGERRRGFRWRADV